MESGGSGQGLSRDYALGLCVSGLIGLALAGWRLLMVPFFLLPFALSLWVFFGTAWNPSSTVVRDEKSTLWLAWGALLVMVGSASTDPELLLYASRPWVFGRLAQLSFLLLLLSYLPGLLRPQQPLRKSLALTRFALFLAVTGLTGMNAIRVSPAPLIDVWEMQTQGAREFWSEHNPYQTVAIANSGPSVPGHPNIPYLYPPTQLLVTSLAYRLAGDVRYAMLAALLLAGMGLRLLTSGKGDRWFGQDAPALFLWLSPKCFFILEQAWAEPILIGLIVLATLAYTRGWLVGAAVLFGLAASAKQTGFWLVPLAGLVLRFGVKEWAALLLSALLPLIPYAAADFVAFKRGMLDFLVAQPLRWDSLTLINGYNLLFDAQAGGALGFVLAAAASLITCWRMRGSLVRFTAALTLVYFIFFLFNRQAFDNYYFLVAGLGALSAAVALGH